MGSSQVTRSPTLHSVPSSSTYRHPARSSSSVNLYTGWFLLPCVLASRDGPKAVSAGSRPISSGGPFRAQRVPAIHSGFYFRTLVAYPLRRDFEFPQFRDDRPIILWPCIVPPQEAVYIGPGQRQHFPC